MKRRTILLAAMLAAMITVAAPAEASTKSRVAKLEKALRATNKNLRATQVDLAQTRRDLADARYDVDAVHSWLSNVSTTVDCFAYTSFDVDTAASFATSTPFVAPSLNASDAGPFYMAVVNSVCILPATTSYQKRVLRPIMPMMRVAR